MSEELTGFMANVVMPNHDAAALDYMQVKLDTEHQIYLTLGFIDVNHMKNTFAEASSISNVVNKVFYVRISGQVYLELQDFARAAELVPVLIQEYYDQLSHNQNPE